MGPAGLLSCVLPIDSVWRWATSPVRCTRQRLRRSNNSGNLSFAFFVLATVLVLNNSIPGYVGTTILHSPPDGTGNPLASTVFGTVVVQLCGKFISIGLAIVLTLASRGNLGSIYAGPGSLCGAVRPADDLAPAPGRPAQWLLPPNGPITFERLLGFTPALLVISFAKRFRRGVRVRTRV
jgi:hypothetical protein